MTEPRSANARWKTVRRRGRDTTYRAVCGRPGCPGSLGRFVDVSPCDASAAESRHAARRENLEEMDRMLATMEQRTDFPPEILRTKRLPFLAKMRGLVAQQLVEVEESRVALVGIADELNRRPELRDRLPDWVLFPEAPHRERETPRGRRPAPIYHGFEDSGYRISTGGHRASRGYRIGRRPRIPGPDRIDLPGLPEVYRDPRNVGGQMPVPPCRIYCPVCGTRNEVGLPPGFVLEPPSP